MESFEQKLFAAAEIFVVLSFAVLRKAALLLILSLRVIGLCNFCR